MKRQTLFILLVTITAIWMVKKINFNWYKPAATVGVSHFSTPKSDFHLDKPEYQGNQAADWAKVDWNKWAENNGGSQTVVAKKVDPKKLAKNDKKKKKDDKKKKEAVAKNKPMAPKKYAVEKKPEAQVTGNGGYAAGTAQQVDGANSAVVTNPKTLADWEAYIMQNPELKNVQDLITAYQTHAISSEWYYYLVDKMLASKNLKFRTLGVYAAGVFKSIESFMRLSEVAMGDESKDLQQRSSQYLAYYNQISDLKVLTSALQIDSMFAKYQAIYLIRKSAEHYLAISDRSRNPSASSYAQTYQQILAHLQILLYDKDQGIRTASQDAIRYIQSALQS